MASKGHTRRSGHTFNGVYAPEDEILDMTMTKKQQKQQKRGSSWSEATVKITTAPTDDDAIRVPPPIEEVSGSGSSNASWKHPDFASWKRDMAGALSFSSSSSSSLPPPISDWTTAQINKEAKNLKLQNQLQSSKSDSSNDRSQGNSSINIRTEEKTDDHSLETTYSASMLNEGNGPNNENRGAQPSGKRTLKNTATEKVGSEPILNNVYVRREKVGRARRRQGQPLSPRSAALDRPSESNPLPSTTPLKKNNSVELAAIMVELAELKVWATKTTDPIANDPPPTRPNTSNSRLRQSTPPSSPTSPAPPASRDVPEKPESWVQLPPLKLPNLLPPPELPTTNNKIKEGKKSKANGLTLDTTIDSMVKATKSKTENRVRFTSPEVTDTIYRPKTPREDINTLFFQEEELLDWEHDEETTLRDRFEVIVTEIDNHASSSPPDPNNRENSLVTGCMLSIGTPVISFHNSYSYSFQESDDDTSHNENNRYQR